MPVADTLASSHNRVGRRGALAGGASLVACRGLRAEAPDEAARRVMVLTIEEHARHAASALEGRGSLDPRVLEAMRRVPRHAFVPVELAASAYEDRPLPIGYGQTISQPFIVALMTDMLRTAPGQVVLEVGTGSGYQAAVLAGLVRAVHTIEIIAPLADTAERRLRALGYSNVMVRRGDGYYGVPEAAPFEGILVTAAAGSIPPPLLGQLRPGGRMVIPVGGGFALVPWAWGVNGCASVIAAMLAGLIGMSLGTSSVTALGALAYLLAALAQRDIRQPGPGPD